MRRAGTPGPQVVGIDEVSIRKRHTYRIVVSDLVRRRPIWFGGTDRSEASMDEFFKGLGAKKSAGIRLAVMDMWKPFRNSTHRHAPQASILFDKFTSSTSCATSARRSTRSGRPSTRASRARTVASSRGRNTRCCPTARI